MSSPIRLNELRFTTAQFIAEEPTTIALKPTRGSAVTTASGGRDFGPATPRAAQTFRVIRDSLPDGIVYSQSDGGRTYQFSYMLVGVYNAIVEIGDTWDEIAPDGSGIHYHVDSIEPNNGWEIRAKVLAYATEPQHGG